MSEKEQLTLRALREMRSALVDLTSLVRDTMPTRGTTAAEDRERYEPIWMALNEAGQAMKILGEVSA